MDKVRLIKECIHVTKVSKRVVKCCNCGKESEQLFVYSVNYSLGDKKSNDDLMNHKQKCPNCGYEAVDISNDIFLQEKYDINPEENIPYEVYGIPKANPEKPIDNNVLKVTKEEIAVSLNNEKTTYQLIIGHYFSSDSYKLALGKDNYSSSVIISREEYQRFIENFYTLTNKWEDSYIENEDWSRFSKNKINWNIFITNMNGVRILHGTDAFPDNWNDFINLLIVIEKLYKKRKYKDE